MKLSTVPRDVAISVGDFNPKNHLNMNVVPPQEENWWFWGFGFWCVFHWFLAHFFLSISGFYNRSRFFWGLNPETSSKYAHSTRQEKNLGRFWILGVSLGFLGFFNRNIIIIIKLFSFIRTIIIPSVTKGNSVQHKLNNSLQFSPSPAR